MWRCCCSGAKYAFSPGSPVFGPGFGEGDGLFDPGFDEWVTLENPGLDQIGRRLSNNISRVNSRPQFRTLLAGLRC